MKKMKHLLLCASLCALPAAGFAAEETFANPKYVRDYFAPQPDWVPKKMIREYTRNIRVPETVWVKYQGAIAPGIRVRMIDEKWIKKEIEFKLIHTSAAKKAMTFDAALEKNADFRTVTVGEMDEEADFTFFTFKLKTKDANPDLIINAAGVGTFKTKDCKDVKKDAEGILTYTFPLTPSKKRLRGMSIVFPQIQGEKIPADYEYTFFDMMFQRKNKHVFVKDIAPRKFIETASGKDVADAYAWIEKNAEASVSVPVKGWTADAVKDSENKAVKIENITAEVDGKKEDALRITWTPAKHNSVLRVKFPVNALEYNTMSFLCKLETPANGLHCKDLELSRIPQFFYFNKFVDNPGVSFAYSGDRWDWNRDIVPCSHLSQGRRESAAAPAGWTPFVFDMVNDDPTGNKGFTYDKIDSVVFTFQNSTIPEGGKVVFTVIRPKFTKGLFYTGGDMERYKKFADWKKELRQDVLTSAKPYLSAPEKGKLAEPVRIMKDRVADMEIIAQNDWQCEYFGVRQNAAELLKNYFTRVLNPLNDIPVLKKPSARDNVKIFLGRPQTKDKDLLKLIADDVKKIGNTPGCAIRKIGKSFYIYGGNFGHVKSDKGIVNGALDFIEYNTGLIFPRWTDAWPAKDYPASEAIFPADTKRDFDLTWGDNYINVPLLKWWGFSAGGSRYAFLNRASYFGCWWDMNTFDFACYRSNAANHWFGFGALNRQNPKDSAYWGVNADGKPYQPGCYTGSPCLVRVIDAGKEEYLNNVFFSAFGKTESVFQVFNQDSTPCWIEDTYGSCMCKDCRSPVRLPDGTLITEKDPDFLAETHIVNATAYNQMIRVYANRNMELNYLIYIYTIPVPRVPLTKYVRAHFCPYVRSDYYEPIYAPCNDKFWRIMSNWSQVARTFGVSDYYLGGDFRPGADVQKLDLEAMADMGLEFFGQETESKDSSAMEVWVMQRQIWEPWRSPDELRNYYCARTFREGAVPVARFYAKLRTLKYSENRSVDFEDWAELGFLALKTPASDTGFFGRKYANLAEELTADLDEALEKVEHPVAKEQLERVKASWLKYLENAKKKI